MSDQWETFCDVGYYHMWRLRRITERGWNDGFHINTRAEAEGLCELLNKLEGEVERERALANEAIATWKETREERDEARERLTGIEIVMRAELGGHPDSELWGEAGLIAATMRCVDALSEVTEQRDSLAKALERILSYQGRFCEEDPESIAAEALQSLTPKR